MSKDDRARTFDDLFGANHDPWAFETSIYERDKRAATMAALSNRRFARGLEVGCAIGVSTVGLAEQCDTLLGIDVSQVALTRAQTRLADKPHVTFQRANIPHQWPTDKFDLIVLSEVLYFLRVEEVSCTAKYAYNAMAVDGVCLLVNWTGANNLPLDGNSAVATFVRSALWKTVSVQTTDQYRIDDLQTSIA